MGFFDRLFGREEQSGQPIAAGGQGRTEDEIAVERYAYLLRTAPPETLEQAHTEAFAKLTPTQRDLLFDRLTENVPPGERPTDSSPATLAKAATRAELQQPGTLARTFGGSSFGGMGGGPSFGSMFGSSLLGSIAGYVIGSALVSTFFPMDYGTDAGAGYGGDQGSDQSADGADSSASGFDGTSTSDGGYGDGGSFGGGGDFGGGDFGGGDF
ncbi:MAG: hypothetical protein QOI70_1185 [Microbacteriaceae bacterium]|jgi:hypothetical protein|nr:hypothetical protein [Microbacteriaceae bacterium]